MRFLDEWLETLRRVAGIDVSLATEFARLRNLVKGYGDTCERGHAKYQAISTFMSVRLHHPLAATQLRGLIVAAQKDEDGAALRAEINRLDTMSAGEQADSGEGTLALQAG